MAIEPGVTGAILDSTIAAEVVTLRPGMGGSLLNKGAATVYLGWNASDVAANTDAAVNKCYLAAGDSVRIPSGVSSFAHKTAAATAKLIFVEA